MKRLRSLAAPILAVLLLAVLVAPGRAEASVPASGSIVNGAPVDPGSTTTTTTTPPADPASPVSSPPDTVLVVGPESGAATPTPVQAPSAPLVQVPPGCPAPPVATVVFVGTVIAKDRTTARYRVEQIRAGSAARYEVTGLVDVRYDDETQYLDVDEQYLVGAGPSDRSGSLMSRVRETDLLFGGNAVIGVSEKNRQCPRVEDPVRTLHVDGTEVASSMFAGIGSAKRKIASAILKPIAVAIAAILTLAVLRWLVTAVFVSARSAADGESILGRRRERRFPGA